MTGRKLKMNEIYRLSMKLGKMLEIEQEKLVVVGQTPDKVKVLISSEVEINILKEKLGVIEVNNFMGVEKTGQLTLSAYCLINQVPDVRKQMVQAMQQQLTLLKELVSSMEEAWHYGSYTLKTFERKPIGIEENEWLTDWNFEHKLSADTILYSYKSKLHEEKRYAVVTDCIVQAEFSEFNMKKLHDYLSEEFPEVQIVIRQ